MSDNKRIDQPTGTETVGHEWDGIEELNTPLPRWWLWTFYATIVFAIGYTVAYPAWPGISGATKGMLGWSSHGALDKELAARDKEMAPIISAIAATPIDQLSTQPKLMQAAIEGGRAAFKVHCVQCHGSGAAGGKGYPNLNDDDWLWGGDIATIEQTITHGIPSRATMPRGSAKCLHSAATAFSLRRRCRTWCPSCAPPAGRKSRALHHAVVQLCSKPIARFAMARTPRAAARSALPT